jgi:trimethylamine--corrinoid protein Co-methyltransferase
MSRSSSVRRKTMSLLETSDLETIDAATLRLLDTTGIEVHDRELRTLLIDAGARKDEGGRRIYVPPELVRDALAQVPRSFKVGDRTGRHLLFPSARTYLMSRGKMPSMLECEDRRTRPTETRDIANLVRLNQALPSVDMVYIVDCPTLDVPEGLNWVTTAREVYLNTLKPLVIAPIHRESAEIWAEMGEAAASQSMLSLPTAIVTISTTSLQLDADSAQALIYCVRKGLPLLTLPIPMAGAVAPFTLAGTLLVQNIEALFLVVAAQAIRASSPVIYGGIGHVMNMRTGRVSLGSPELPLCNSAIVALAQYYDLPSYNATGYTDSTVPDFQAGAEKMLSIYSTLLCGADLALVGTLDNSVSTSLETLVMDHDLWEAAQRSAHEIVISMDSLAEDVVARVGPGGSFLVEGHTLEWLRRGEHYYGGSFNRDGTLEKSKTMLHRARRQAVDLIAKPSAVPSSLAERVQAYARDRSTELGQLGA